MTEKVDVGEVLLCSIALAGSTPAIATTNQNTDEMSRSETPGAERARRSRERRGAEYKAELDKRDLRIVELSMALDSALTEKDDTVERMHAMQSTLKRNYERDTKKLGWLITVFVVITALSWATFAFISSDDWHTEVPPSMQKLEVVTYGWYHPKRGWCSYTDGGQMDVRQWRP